MNIYSPTKDGLARPASFLTAQLLARGRELDWLAPSSSFAAQVTVRRYSQGFLLNATENGVLRDEAIAWNAHADRVRFRSGQATITITLPNGVMQPGSVEYRSATTPPRLMPQHRRVDTTGCRYLLDLSTQAIQADVYHRTATRARGEAANNLTAVDRVLRVNAINRSLVDAGMATNDRLMELALSELRELAVALPAFLQTAIVGWDGTSPLSSSTTTMLRSTLALNSEAGELQQQAWETGQITIRGNTVGFVTRDFIQVKLDRAETTPRMTAMSRSRWRDRRAIWEPFITNVLGDGALALCCVVNATTKGEVGGWLVPANFLTPLHHQYARRSLWQDLEHGGWQLVEDGLASYAVFASRLKDSLGRIAGELPSGEEPHGFRFS